MNILFLILAMTLVTFSIRLCSLWFFSSRNFSALTMRTLSLVPVAVLTSICTPLVLKPSGIYENPFMLIEFWAAIGSLVVARFGMLPALAVGMGIFTLGKLFI